MQPPQSPASIRIQHRKLEGWKGILSSWAIGNFRTTPLEGQHSNVMDFENDIFISYAHIDNLPLAKDQEGWISTFDRALAIRLAQLRGQHPRVWRDPKL